MDGQKAWAWFCAGDRLAGAVLIAMATAVLWESRLLPLGTLLNPGAAFMPIALAVVVLLCGALLIVTGSVASLSTADIDWRRVPAILGAAAFAAWAMDRIGYRLTMLIVLGFLVGVVERRSILATALFAAGMAFGTFYVFDTLLRTPLPRGPFGI